MAPSTTYLTQILKAKVKLKADFIHEKLPWCGKHFLALLCYLIKFGFDSEPGPLSDAVSSLDDTAQNYLNRRYGYVNFFQLVLSFMPELKKFFEIPNLQNDDLERYELVAAFINFMVQLFECKPYWVAPVEGLITTLHKELKFLITVLGDTPFRCCTELDEDSNKLLDKFEVVANLSGSLAYSFFFSTNRVEPHDMEKLLCDLLKRIEVLKSKIKKHTIKSLKKTSITPKAAPVDSIFIVDSLVDDLEMLMNGEIEMASDVKDLIGTLHEELISSGSFLNNTKAAEIEELKEVVVNIRDAAYEAEYLVKSFVVGEVPVWYLTLRLSSVVKKIKKKYDDVRLSEPPKNRFNTAQANNSPAHDHDIVVGFEDKEIEILDQLVREVPVHRQIITIFGMPGLGKTTLAKKLYNNPLVASQFHIYAWVVISQTYQLRNILIDILVSLSKMDDKNTLLNVDDDSLGTSIYQTLKGRRYLIVMDNIWDSRPWDDLRKYFPDDVNGSRVLFTSRNRDVVPSSSNTIHTLPLLSIDQCWELLEKKVFHEEACPQELVYIGKQIAANCRGLPLTVVVIAGILAKVEKQESVWSEVKWSFGSYIFANQDIDCMEILDLSYKHLPDHLKPCFLYFGAFGKQVSVRRLIQLWISEGFVRKEEDKSQERVAGEYLMELIDRSLVIVSEYISAGGVKTCNIHDLLRGLCSRKIGEGNFLKVIGKDYSICERHHRLFVYPNSTQYTSPSSQPFGLHVRSFLGHLPYPISFSFQNMKLVRILDLLSMHTGVVSCDLDEIGLLVHLRYLAINDYIPASISSLVNLEFLIVRSASYGIIVIPSSLLRMASLRHVHVKNKARFGEEDCSTQLMMNNLESLSFVCVLELSDVETLRRSPHLRKLKCMCGPLFPDLRFLVQLDTLKLKYMSNFRGVLTEIINFPENIRINFPENIRKLTLWGMRLPWERMSIVGKLPNLEVLKLENDAFVGEMWQTSDDQFQKLQFLKLEDIGLEEWNTSSEHFPMLKRLVLSSCYGRLKIPSELGDISTLEMIKVQRCRNTTVESALQIQNEQREMGNEELKVFVTRGTNISSVLGLVLEVLRPTLGVAFNRLSRWWKPVWPGRWVTEKQFDFGWIYGLETRTSLRSSTTSPPL